MMSATATAHKKIGKALEPPERLSPDLWADRYRRLTRDDSAEPGQFRCARTPYVRGILQAYADEETREIVGMTSAQIAKSATMLNCIGYTIDLDPDPILLVQPREDDSDYFQMARVMPMIKASPRLRSLMDWSSPRHVKAGQIFIAQRDVFLYFGSAQSPASLQGKPVGRLFMDEVDRYQKYSGKEGNPIKLAYRRLTTFGHRRKLAVFSTPTLAGSSHIEARFEAGDRQRYFLPCPHCGVHQVLQFGQIKFPADVRDPNRIVADELAWYECESCEARIENGDKFDMLARGVWCPEGMTVDAGGELEGVRPPKTIQSFWLWAAYSPWITFSEIAADFLQSKDNPEDLMEFTNQVLGQSFAENVDRLEGGEIRAHVEDYQAGTVPEEAVVLLAGVDVQKDHCWFLIRAFGLGEESWLVRYGQAPHGQEERTIVDALMRTQYTTPSGRPVPMRLALMDSRYRTDWVYKFCARYAEVLVPAMGHNRTLAQHIGFRNGRWNVDAAFYKDRLYRLIRSDPEQDIWHLPQNTEEVYYRHLLAERRVEEVDRATGFSKIRWIKTRRDNHLFDCETLTLAASDVVGVRHLKEPETPRAQRHESLEVRLFSRQD
jgi:phage terminase large subunit GpA-like protein